MKKKLLAATLTATLLIAGCNVTANGSAYQSERDKTMVTVECHTINGEYYYILADKETGVMYLWISAYYGGGLTVMLNADGTPKIWNGEE